MTLKQKNITDFLFQLYQDASPAVISNECRKKHDLQNHKSFVYGEGYLPSMYKIFKKVKPQTGEVFYDLGSGSGRMVLFAALSFPFKKCIGVELLDGLVDLAQEKLKLIHKKLPELAQFDAKRLEGVKFIQEDLTKTDVRDADIIYVSSTCFDEKLMQKLTKLLEKQVAPGTRVITCTKNLQSEHFKIHSSQLYQMEWGEVTVFFQEKI